MDDRRFYCSPTMYRRDSSNTTETSLLSLLRQQQQEHHHQEQHQNHVHQRLLSLLETRNDRQQQQPQQQQQQQPLSAEELLQNILRRGNSRAGGGMTLNAVTMERTRAAAAASAASIRPAAVADPHIPLPSKLFSILGNKHFEHIVSWLPQGRAFRIHNVDLFAQRILPMFFVNNNVNIMGQQQPSSVKNKNLRVFTQQLESWGFCELSRGPNSVAYYSEVSQSIHCVLFISDFCDDLKRQLS
jgi:HSF-type DNA-binding